MLIDGHRGHPAHRDLNFWALPRAADGYGRAGRRERRNSGGRRPLDRGAATQTLRPEVPNSCNPDRPEDEIIVSLGSEVCRNLSHALALSDAKGAPAIAVTATDALPCMMLQIAIVLGRQLIPHTRQVVILVDQTDLDAGRTGLAMVAIHAPRLARLRGHGREDGIVALLG